MRNAVSARITVGEQREDTVLVRALHAALAVATALDESRLPDWLLEMPGMSGQRYRRFANALIAAVPDARYLEVGCWAGSTLCAAIHGNRVRAFGIDDWSMFGGPLQHFLRHLGQCDLGGVELNVLTQDFRRVDYTAIGRFNVYLFDGPHETQDQHDGLVLAAPALDDEFVLIVDDWNWPSVRDGTASALRQLDFEVLQTIEVRTTLDDSTGAIAGQGGDWHNGYWMAVLRKPLERLQLL